jgi:hypothetical protein
LATRANCASTIPAWLRSTAGLIAMLLTLLCRLLGEA